MCVTSWMSHAGMLSVDDVICMLPSVQNNITCVAAVVWLLSNESLVAGPVRGNSRFIQSAITPVCKE